MIPRHGLVTTEAKVAFLMQPGAYPEPTRRVDALETHMSWVFLTDRHAYKLKKPVVYDYLDFGTVAARRRNCREELRLNRRLAPDVYLDIVPLAQREPGALRLAGPGEVVDWLVKMRRLPAAGMLDALIRHNRVCREHVRSLGDLLAGFYAQAQPIPMTAGEYRRRFEAGISANLRELTTRGGDLPVAQVQAIHTAQLDTLGRCAEQLGERATAGRIVEAHGDLRPEHICFDPQPVIIDCLEFNRDFRLLDPWDELAFLALECEHLGGAVVGQWVLETYGNATGDVPQPSVVHFYTSYRAALRAKLAIWHLREPVTDAPKWRQRARSYLDLAEAHIAQCRPAASSDL